MRRVGPQSCGPHALDKPINLNTKQGRLAGQIRGSPQHPLGRGPGAGGAMFNG